MKPGDKVQFIAEKRSAFVVKVISSQQLLIEDEDGFQYEVGKQEVMPLAIQDWKLDEIKVNSFSQEVTEEKKSKYLKRVWKVNNGIAQVDLHFHELTEHGEQVGDAQLFQIKVFKEALAHAQKSRARELIVIHGVGEGVLRQSLQRVLQETTTFEFMDGDYRKYGFGALRIFLK